MSPTKPINTSSDITNSHMALPTMPTTGVKRPGDGDNGGSAAKRPKVDYEGTMDVLVGNSPEQKRFLVHKGVFGEKSPLFYNAFPSAGTGSKVVSLQDHEARTFDVVLHWKYFKTIDMERMGSRRLHDFALIWKLADFLECNELKNHVMDELVGMYSQSRPLNSVVMTYDIATPGSGLRRALVDFCVTMPVNFPKNQQEASSWPQGLLVDMAKKSWAEQLRRDWTPAKNVKKDRCYYHDHGKGEPKCK